MAEQIQASAAMLVLTVKSVLLEEQAAEFVKAMRDLATVMLNENIIMNSGVSSPSDSIFNPNPGPNTTAFGTVSKVGEV